MLIPPRCGRGDIKYHFKGVRTGRAFMAYQIIIQPNNNFALWCSANRELIIYDATRDELVEFMLNQRRAQIIASTKRYIKMIRDGNNPYGHNAQTWEGVLKHIRETEGVGGVDDFLASLKTDEV